MTFCTKKIYFTRHKKNSTPWRPFWTPSTDFVVEFRDAARGTNLIKNNNYFWNIIFSKIIIFIKYIFFKVKFFHFKKIDEHRATPRKIRRKSTKIGENRFPRNRSGSFWECSRAWKTAKTLNKHDFGPQKSGKFRKKKLKFFGRWDPSQMIGRP